MTLHKTFVTTCRRADIAFSKLPFISLSSILSLLAVQPDDERALPSTTPASTYGMSKSYPVLDIRPDVLKELDGVDALTGLCFCTFVSHSPAQNNHRATVFSKCKSSLDNGRRLENISWRLWSREMATSTAEIPSQYFLPIKD